MNFFKSKLNVVLLFILLALLGVGGFFGYKMFIKPDVLAINFSDMSSQEISAWFNDNKLSDKLVIEEDYDDTVAQGRVIYQSVKEGDPIKNKVTVIISKGKDPNSKFDIPADSQTYDSIKLWFSEHGFNNVSYTYTDNSEVESGKVLSVNPSKASPDEAITVEIAGKEMLNVPDFSANTKTEIDTWAKDHNITVKYLYESSSSVKEGGVIKQSIAAGQNITEGGTITITLSQGDVKTATIPATMLGTSEDSFLKAVKDLGFTSIKKDTTTYFSVKSAKGTIFSYDDGNLPLNETINYAISAGQYTFDKTEYEGKSLTKVQEMVKEYNTRNAHITLETTEEKSNDVNAGNLYSCTSEFKSPNITISCKLSKGDGTTTKATLPANLLGSSESDFLAKCKSLGFTNVVKDESGYYSTLNAKGTVAYYDPDGEMLTSTKITYRLSLGAYSFNASDFNGKSLSDGEALIKKYNELNAHITSTIKTSGSGTSLSGCSSTKDGINTTISCKLTGSSSGSDTPTGTKATLPTNLLGYSESNFLDKCKSLGFTNVVKDESGYYSTLNAKGTIAYYDPDGYLDTGTKITYRLSLGAYSYNAADFNGKTKAEAEALIKNLNSLNAHITSAVSTSETTSATVEKGKLFDCRGLQSGITTTVSCMISSGSPAAEDVKAQIVDADTLISFYSVPNDYNKAWQQVKDYFTSNGFDNLTINAVSSTKSVGTIVSVSVNGNKNYATGEYLVTTPIVVEICNNQTN